MELRSDANNPTFKNKMAVSVQLKLFIERGVYEKRQSVSKSDKEWGEVMKWERGWISIVY